MPQVIVTREFAAPRELLFRAYVDPDLLVQWAGPLGLTMTIDHFDPRHGGTWRYVSSDAHGNEYSFHGVFHGTPSLDGIVETVEFDGMPGHVCMDTVTFTGRGNTTVLTQNTVFQTVADRDEALQSNFADGINVSMKRLEQLLARLDRAG